MTQSQKLEALVQKAIDNDFMPDFEYPFSHFYVTTEPFSGETHRATPAILFIFKMSDSRTITYVENPLLLFNHGFARALFPAKFPTYQQAHEHYDYPESIFEWQYRLQQAVVSDDPISYMYEAVFNA